MEQPKTIFDAWFNNTNQLVNQWREMTEKVNNEQKNIWEEAAKVQQNWVNSFQKMVQNMQSSAGASAFNPFGSQITQEAFFNMLKSGYLHPAFSAVATGVSGHAKQQF